MPSLRDQISSLLLAANPDDLISIACGPDADHHANELADHIIRLLAQYTARNLDWITDLLALPILPEPPAPPSPAPQPATFPADLLPLAHIDTPPEPDLAMLCANAGLTYCDIDFREFQPVVIARDRDGLREYYTLPTLRAIAAQGGPRA